MERFPFMYPIKLMSAKKKKEKIEEVTTDEQ